jgi:hypothetical protein
MGPAPAFPKGDIGACPHAVFANTEKGQPRLSLCYSCRLKLTVTVLTTSRGSPFSMIGR